MPLRALLLDLDGTVAASLPALERVYLTFLSDRGREGSAEEFRALNGPMLPEIVERLKKRHDLPGDVPELVADYRRRIFEVYSGAVPPAEGALELLRRAASLGIRVALVTTCPADIALAFLEAHGLDRYFETLVTAVGLPRGKPDPGVYQRALDRMGLAPEDALAVEDSASGVASATAAGVRVVALGRGAPPEPPQGLCDVARILERECGSSPGAAIPLPPGFRIEVSREGRRLDAAVEERIETIWRAWRDRRGSGVFDGSVLSHEGYRDGVLRCRVEPYRRFVAAREDGDLFRELDLRPVGVSGVCRAGGAVLFGERSRRVTQYAGRLELAPSGGLDVSAVGPDGSADFAGHLLRELKEETGLAPERVTAVRAFALYLDIPEQVFDVCCEITLDGEPEDAEAAPGKADEYIGLRWMPEGRVPSYVGENRARLVPCSLAMLELLGLA